MTNGGDHNVKNDSKKIDDNEKKQQGKAVTSATTSGAKPKTS